MTSLRRRYGQLRPTSFGHAAGVDESVVYEALDAMARGDVESLRLLLHPYLRWTTSSGDVIRGRNNVLGHVRDVAPEPDDTLPRRRCRPRPGHVSANWRQ
jgi:hypothetical protein